MLPVCIRNQTMKVQICLSHTQKDNLAWLSGGAVVKVDNKDIE